MCLIIFYTLYILYLFIQEYLFIMAIFNNKIIKLEKNNTKTTFLLKSKYLIILTCT